MILIDVLKLLRKVLLPSREEGLSVMPMVDVLSSSLGAAVLLFLLVVVMPQGGDETSGDKSALEGLTGAIAAGRSFVQTEGSISNLLVRVEFEQVPGKTNWTGVKIRNSAVNTMQSDTGQYQLIINNPDYIPSKMGMRIDSGAIASNLMKIDIISSGQSFFSECQVLPGSIVLFKISPGSEKLFSPGPSVQCS